MNKHRKQHSTMTGCQKSKNAHHSWLPILNIDARYSNPSSNQHTDTHSNKHWPTSSRAQYLVCDVIYFRKNSDFP